MVTKGKASEVGETSPTDKSKEVLDNLVGDVLGTPAPQPDSKETLDQEPEQGLEEEQQEGLEDEQSEESDQLDESDEADQDDQSEEDEDVVPASKHKKVLEKMQKRIDKLVAERESARIKEQETAKTPEQKLASLSVEELSELRENVDESIMDAKVSAKVDGTDVSERLSELKALKKSIDQTVKDLPKRFQAKQLDHLNKMAETVKEIDPGVVEQKGELWNTAVRVYQRMPSLQRSETGQAEALAIAAEYYLEQKSFQGSREKANTLSRRVNKLKAKTALDSKNRVANQADTSQRKLRDKALKGTYDDKLAFVKTLVPDEFIQP